jgi:uncharacterized protein (DUF433 family)
LQFIDTQLNKIQMKLTNFMANPVYMAKSQRISIDPEVRFGKPCITGTRIAVGDILSWLASGMNYKEIQEDYPAIKEEDILAALAFAANRESMVKILVG